MREHKILFKTSLLIVFFIALFACNLANVNAADIVINNTSNEGIKGTINNDNDTINLIEGTYSGRNNTNISIAYGKNIIIKSQNPNKKAIIDCNGSWFINNNGNLSLINLIVKNAFKSGIGGGAIYNNGSLTIINCTFINNTADLNGGAIINSDGCLLNINNSKFINNTAKNVGGAIYNKDSSSLNLINSQFNGNNADYAAGSIFNGVNANLNVINSNFTNNTANNYGGAIQNNGILTISDSKFVNNSASFAGAILNALNNLTVDNSYFINNSAYFGNGGAIHNLFADLNVKNSIFINNTANNKGGAIYIYYSTLRSSITNSIFNANSAINFGGGIYNNGNISVSKNIMSNNTAILGGTIYNNGSMGVLNLTYLGNKTIRVDNNTYVILFAVLTDDMGNTVTGQDISFFVNGTFVGNMTVVDGYANITYLVTHGRGVVSVTGDYAGHDGFDIVIRDGQLLIANNTFVDGNISFDKDEYFVNETANLKVNITNNGLDKAYDVIVKVNLPKNFVLNKNSVVVSHGYYDFGTNTWFIGDLEVDEEAIMTFSGYFTKTGNYTADIITSGLNFNTTTDIDNTEVKQNVIPAPNPTPTPNPISPNLDNNDTNNPYANSVNASMKETGMSIIAVLLVLLSSLGLLGFRKRK